MPFVVPIVDAFRNLMPVPTGYVRDDTCSQPAKSLPKRLYVWPMRTGAQRPTDTPDGRTPDPILRLAMLFTAGSKGEPRVNTRDRNLSVLLDNATSDIVAAIVAQRRNALWWDVYVESVVYDAVRNEETRGHGINVALRLNAPIGG